MDKSKKLYKANTGKMLDGVCAGFAEYFGIDPTLVRVVWAPLLPYSPPVEIPVL